MTIVADCLIADWQKLPVSALRGAEEFAWSGGAHGVTSSVFGILRPARRVLWLPAMNPQAEHLKERTARFAERIVRFVRELPNTIEARKIGGQLLDSATSMAANYRAACRARSHAEFVAKLGTVVEEADETQGWLSLLVRCDIVSAAPAKPLVDEINELLAIFTASHKTASGRLRHRTTIPNRQ